MPSAFRKYSRAFIRRSDGTELDVGDVVEVKEETQPAIADKSRQLSVGYTCNIDETPGAWVDSNGVEHHYDSVVSDMQPTSIRIGSVIFHRTSFSPACITIEPDNPLSLVSIETQEKLSKHPNCLTCRNYHGGVEGGNWLCCAIHPHGPDANSCGDWEKATR